MLDSGGAVLDYEFAFFFILEHFIFFLWLANFCFGNDRKTPTNTEKSPVTVDELQELIKLLAKYIATTKGANLQKTDATAHGLLVKWNKFQLDDGLQELIKVILVTSLNSGFIYCN